jgi:hypothetical protein
MGIEIDGPWSSIVEWLGDYAPATAAGYSSALE